MKISILGISEVKWTGMVEFNLDYHYIYYCGQESLRRLSHSHKASGQINFTSYLAIKFMKIFPGENICCHMFQ